MKVLLAAIALLFVTSSAIGQQPRRSRINLAGTTWTIYYKECGQDSRQDKWEEYLKITFLSGGRIKGSEGSWKLVANNLSVSAPDLVIADMKVSISGNEMTGTSDLSLSNPMNFCVRLLPSSGNPINSTRLADSIKIGEIRNPGLLGDGCGCSYKLVGSKRSADWILLTISGEVRMPSGNWERQPALMNIDGQDVRLAFLNTTRNKDRERRGNRYSESYIGTGLTVQVDYRIETTPKPGEEVGLGQTVTITVKKGDRTQTIKATGGCGC